MGQTYGALDPYYRERRLERFGDVGQMFVGLVQQKRQKEEERRRAELQRALQMIERYPEVVDQPEGEALAQRFPEIAPILKVVKDRQRTAHQVEQSGQSYLDRAGQLAQRYTAMAQTPQQPLAGIGPLANAPELAAAAPAPLAPGQPVADMAMAQAARTMTPQDRAAAEVWAKKQGVSFPKLHTPEVFDPWKDLPQKVRGALAAQEGQIEGQAADAANIAANLEEGAREKVRRDLDAARSSRSERSAAISERGLDLRERGLRLRESGAAGGGKPASQKTELKKHAQETAEAIQGRREASWKSRLKLMGWELDDPKQGTYKRRTEDGTYERKKQSEILRENKGLRAPHPPQESHLDLIAAAVNRRLVTGKVDPGTAAVAVERAIERYMALLDEGKTPQQAYRILTSGGT